MCGCDMPEMQVKFEEFAVELSHKDSFLRRREQAMGLTGKKEKPRDKKVASRLKS